MAEQRSGTLSQSSHNKLTPAADLEPPHSDRSRRCGIPSSQKVGQLCHFLFSTVVVVVWMVEFALPPPFYDSFPTVGRLKELPSTDEVTAAIGPPVDGPGKLHRVMDTPIILTILIYYYGCLYFRFRGWSWILTSVVCLVVTLYCVVHFSCDEYFDWRYFSTRAQGIIIQIVAMSLLGSLTFTLIQAKRGRFKFHLQNPMHKGEKMTRRMFYIHLAWNLIGNFGSNFICLVMWSAGSYQSFAFVQSPRDVSYLCQITPLVICLPCSSPTRAAFDSCALNNTKDTHVCANVRFERGFCLFNYSVGYFTFIRLFAYTGGLFFFACNFINALSHYLWMSLCIARNWWHDHGEERLTSLRRHRSLYTSLLLSSSRQSLSHRYRQARSVSKHIYSEEESLYLNSDSEDVENH